MTIGTQYSIHKVGFQLSDNQLLACSSQVLRLAERISPILYRVTNLPLDLHAFESAASRTTNPELLFAALQEHPANQRNQEFVWSKEVSDLITWTSKQLIKEPLATAGVRSPNLQPLVTYANQHNLFTAGRAATFGAVRTGELDSLPAVRLPAQPESKSALSFPFTFSSYGQQAGQRYDFFRYSLDSNHNQTSAILLKETACCQTTPRLLGLAHESFIVGFLTFSPLALRISIRTHYMEAKAELETIRTILDPIVAKAYPNLLIQYENIPEDY